MTRDLLRVIVAGATAFGFIGHLALRGYMQRRPFWTWRSWWRFGAVCGFGIALLAISFAMNAAADRGIFRTTITTADGKSLYILALVGLMMAGVCIVTGALSWLALGDPERPFPGVTENVAHPDDASPVRLDSGVG